MASVTFQASAENTTTAIEYTFSSIDFGTAAANRYIIVGVSMKKQDAGDDITNTTVTIGGVSATRIKTQAASDTTTTPVVSLYIANVPTGTSGDVYVNIGTFVVDIGIGVWRTTGISATPTDTDGSSADDPTVNLDVLAGGIIVGVVINTTALTTASWSGLTESYDDQIGAITYGGASLDSATTQTVTCTADFAAPTAGGSRGAFASFPAVASGPANLKTYNTNVVANIKTINTNVIANVKTLNTNV